MADESKLNSRLDRELSQEEVQETIQFLKDLYNPNSEYFTKSPSFLGIGEKITYNKEKADEARFELSVEGNDITDQGVLFMVAADFLAKELDKSKKTHPSTILDNELDTIIDRAESILGKLSAPQPSQIKPQEGFLEV